ncbi:aminotransferase class III-fold pyridoxal phosphate-dependent enzyme [Microbacterium sp. LRZ72]|uniref:aspartate aminotransferase family protein n=1 Tax=Microbacterium sp. LRZ72 TaxID=2942481 RepID=UPI0029B68CAC|nr:aminotransferase class III-fold pyridoxal phosphate-dependent enzyme [Microbacterium sp. LRZ72]MDX2376773.1 aminotransferase class III-fold pyridoxal phosphate-dependent enzyme [Microbacterium sp. LRZ72]
MPTATEDLLAQARTYIPGGVNSATRSIGSPSGFRTAKGSRLVDFDGREYVDYHAAFGAILLGHSDDRVNAAVQRSLGDLDLVGLGVTELEIEVARLTAELIPSVEMSISTMSGTEATMQAVRLSRAITGRKYLLKFQGCFHGWHDAVALNVASSAERAYTRDPLSAGILDDALDSTLVAEFNDLGSVKALFEAYPDQIAAIILEPVPHNVGALMPDQAFLEGLRDLSTREGSILIFDEVITGFRHAPGGYQELCGITPDLTSYGKGMGNGFAVAGMGGRADLMSRFSSAGGDVVLAGTFNGNPVSMAAAIETMTLITDPEVGFHAHTARLGERMREGLREITGRLGIATTITGLGSVFICYFMDGPVKGYRDLLRNNDTAYATFHRRMTDAGFVMYPMTLKRNHISGAHSDDDIDRTLEAAEGVLAGMQKDGFFA